MLVVLFESFDLLKSGEGSVRLVPGRGKKCSTFGCVFFLIRWILLANLIVVRLHDYVCLP